MRLNKISESKANTFKECRYKFKVKYVDKIPELETGDGAMQFGSYIHKILEDGVNATTYQELEAIAESVKANYTFNPSYNSKLKPCLENFLKFNAKLTNTIATEHQFEIKLGKSVIFNGVIDRLIGGDNGDILVIDYKTSKNEKSKADLYQDNQLKGYTFAVSKLYNKRYDKIHVAHFYPITGHFIPLQYTQSQINAWLKSMERTVGMIRKTKKDECMPSRNVFCNHCAYKSICPEFNDALTIKQRLHEYTNKQ